MQFVKLETLNAPGPRRGTTQKFVVPDPPVPTGTVVNHPNPHPYLVILNGPLKATQNRFV